MSIQVLLAEAVALGGGNLCASGHDWQYDNAGRTCPRSPDDGCSMSVFRCHRCGDVDYGERGGPGDHECRTNCRRAEMLAASSAGEKR